MRSLDRAAAHGALLALVDAVLDQPLRGQVRVQDARGTTPVLFEFDVHAGAPLVPSLLVNQPAAGVNPEDLAAFVSDHQADVLADADVLPSAMLAASASATPREFPLPGVPQNIATAFTNTTCSGCHTSEPTLDGTFHISPLRRGQDALSSFLLDPNGRPDELSRRADVLRGLLCQ